MLLPVDSDLNGTEASVSVHNASVVIEAPSAYLSTLFGVELRPHAFP